MASDRDTPSATAYSVEDGFGSMWTCRHDFPSGTCCMEVIRPGEARCVCDEPAVGDLLRAARATPSTVKDSTLPFPFSVYDADELEDILRAIGELCMACGSPAVMAEGHKTIESETIRFAAQRIRETRSATASSNQSTDYEKHNDMLNRLSGPGIRKA